MYSLENRPAHSPTQVGTMLLGLNVTVVQVRLAEQERQQRVATCVCGVVLVEDLPGYSLNKGNCR